MQTKQLTKQPITQFSKELIEETIKCFKDENNHVLTPEQASEILTNFSGLFLAVTKNN